MPTSAARVRARGSTLNLPLPHGTGFAAWSAALEVALAAVADFGPAAVVVSLGVDTFHGDPISRFRLDTPDYPPIGSRIAGLGLPTLFVMEGGYAVEAIGVNAVGVLEGFERAVSPGRWREGRICWKAKG